MTRAAMFLLIPLQDIMNLGEFYVFSYFRHRKVTLSLAEIRHNCFLALNAVITWKSLVRDVVPAVMIQPCGWWNEDLEASEAKRST
jgi:hypothetical protein